MIKKTISPLLFLVFLLSASHAMAITIDLVPSDTIVHEGDSINVDVVVSGLAAATEIVSAYDFYITYDLNILSATGASFSSFLGGDPITPFTDLGTPGTVGISDFSFEDDGFLADIQPASFTLATLNFVALLEGMSDLLFDLHPFFDIYDVKGTDATVIPVSVGSSKITVLKSVSVPEPGSLVLLLSGLLFLGLGRSAKK